MCTKLTSAESRSSSSSVTVDSGRNGSSSSLSCFSWFFEVEFSMAIARISSGGVEGSSTSTLTLFLLAVKKKCSWAHHWGMCGVIYDQSKFCRALDVIFRLTLPLHFYRNKHYFVWFVWKFLKFTIFCLYRQKRYHYWSKNLSTSNKQQTELFELAHHHHSYPSIVQHILFSVASTNNECNKRAYGCCNDLHGALLRSDPAVQTRSSESFEFRT